ncbi:preprotein translocase subunit SecY [Caulobacter vibrioides]|uniref:preprotein translocase subunit SecY n=1 Tax=Caulobacter vibrioides TaxID=155892 RepID=UPI000BB52687|nr:preprotein translocase subunit SecY [Caulobacter vibrioides]ATC24203.1 preprotein translocase subunit SecY [Caulobacter vibrioides]AZH12448.1 preprotein translocase subunit SecY [Caulobacter vibrioides]PLR08210.1 preprotein translocase subunit SecY [Caulobacter vibrioides]
MASAAEQLAANMNFASFQKATELHKRIWFTIIALIVYRLGTYVPIPGVDPAAFASLFSQNSKGLLGMFDMFSGGAVERMAIFSLNVMPYISASIIVQLMGTVYPPWEKLKKEGGEAGRKTLNQYTRYLAVILAVVQSASIAIGIAAQPGVVADGVGHTFFIVSTIVALTGGTMFLMWLGEQITSRGVGNGVSLIIFAGIVATLPISLMQMLTQAQSNNNYMPLFLVVFGGIAAILAIVFIERSQRRLLVHYPKRQQGNRMIGGESSFMPLKINTAGVIPPIFASSLLLLPTTALQFVQTTNLPNWASWLPAMVGALQHGQPAFLVLYALLIIFFSFFYTSVVFNPDETAENLRKYGGFLPGIRPGKRTAEYLDYVLTRLTVIGAAYITAVCIAPEFVMMAMNSTQFALGGTSILIVVTVTMDTVAQIQSHLLAHQYEGLIKKSKLRGGRGR